MGGSAYNFSLTDGQHTMFNGPRRRCFIHPRHALMPHVWKVGTQHRPTSWGVGRKPYLHATNNSTQVMVVAPMVNEGDIEELEGEPNLGEPMSDLDRIPTHIEGLDEKMQGGIPQGHICIVAGASGAMKSSLTFSIAGHNSCALRRNKWNLRDP